MYSTVVIDINNNGLYKLGSKNGIIDRLYACKELIEYKPLNITLRMASSLS